MVGFGVVSGKWFWRIKGQGKWVVLWGAPAWQDECGKLCRSRGCACNVAPTKWHSFFCHG